MKLYIKNMVCTRSKMIVKSELEKNGLQYNNVEIGIVDTLDKIISSQHSAYDPALEKPGFELIDNQNSELIDNLKKAIIELELFSNEDLKTSFADFIILSVDDNFISLNNLFADLEGVTIDKHIIKHKIARMKELLVLCMMISCLPKLLPGYNTAAQQN